MENGIPYAIDFMNPAPDADLHSVGPANFDWIVREVADLAIAKAHIAPHLPELRWSAFLGAETARPARKRPLGEARSSGRNQIVEARQENCRYASSTFSVMPMSESFSAGIWTFNAASSCFHFELAFVPQQLHFQNLAGLLRAGQAESLHHGLLLGPTHDEGIERAALGREAHIRGGEVASACPR